MVNPFVETVQCCTDIRQTKFAEHHRRVVSDNGQEVMHMFEPLPDLIRLRRKRRNLTQEQLAKMAGVSRRQLSLLEDGANVSLLFLLKVCKELTDLQLGALRLRSAPPELSSLIAAADAMVTAQEIVSQYSDLSGQLGEAAASIDALVERAIAGAGPTDAIQAGTRATPAPKPRKAAKATARRRTR